MNVPTPQAVSASLGAGPNQRDAGPNINGRWIYG